MMCLMMEVGSYSKQPCMANVNHRSIDYIAMNNAIGTSDKSMYDSFLSTDPDDRLDTNRIVS